MKKRLFAAIAAVLMFSVGFAQTANNADNTESPETYERLTGIPKPPVAGTTIDFAYSPKGTALEGMDNLVALVYMYNNYRWQLGDVELVKDGDLWKGHFYIPENCAFMAMQFQSTWSQFAQEKDNNDNKGFLYVVSDGQGQPLPGGELAWGLMRRPSAALGIAGYFNDGFAEIEQDALYFWYQKELQRNQDKAGLFFETMMRIVQLQTGDRFPEAAEIFFSIFSKQGQPSEKNYIVMENIYRSSLKDTQKADSVHQLILANYPEGWTVRRKVFDDVYLSGKDFHETMMAALKKYPVAESEQLDAYQPFVYYNAVRAIATDFFTGQYDQKDFIDIIPQYDFKTLAEVYRTTVSPFHTKKAVKDELNYPVGKVLIEELLKKVEDKSYVEDTYLSPSQSDFLARRILDEHLGNFADILLCLNKPAEALKYIEMISADRRYTIPEVNETHIKALRQTKNKKKVEGVFKASLAANAVTSDMMEMMKADYVKKHKSDAGFEEYVNSMKSKEEAAAMKAEISKRLIKVPYTAFSLPAMDGGNVHSADWEGKVVVLDFWASWCFPCKNSFPGMQMAVDRFKDDPDVLFYFIDTMERGEGYEAKAKEYMEQKGFTFNVLFDSKSDTSKQESNSAVFSQMNEINHSMAIPRKMVLKDGYVRYTEEGYGGSPSKLADEVTYVIEMLKAEK
ncbi:MAG: TlpA family protein disulfide reductase [Bacteroides sp.]|nr:TlpA family protein disulfide reductase [Roseburia sp.]MCM1347032.1 TlpA family protein disulfide reductase [Bacteroides sp.]MCM1421525.1 TlpA family protein disulfide reductase [Bacteroides sp.]